MNTPPLLNLYSLEVVDDSVLSKGGGHCALQHFYNDAHQLIKVEGTQHRVTVHMLNLVEGVQVGECMVMLLHGLLEALDDCREALVMQLRHTQGQEEGTLSELPNHGRTHLASVAPSSRLSLGFLRRRQNLIARIPR